MGKVVAVLEDQSCGACDGCANGCKLDRESPQVEPAAPHQGEPAAVGRVSYIGNGFVRVRLNGSAPLLESPLYAKQPAPVAVVLPFAEKVIAKLQRFEACVSDGQVNCSAWEIQHPAEPGWFILSIHDAEDGPVCIWGRQVTP